MTTAMKMESHGIPGKVHVSRAVLDRLEKCVKVYNVENRGEDAAVPGQNTTFLVISASRTQDASGGNPADAHGGRKVFQTAGHRSTL